MKKEQMMDKDDRQEQDPGTVGDAERRKRRTIVILTVIISAIIIVTMSGRVWSAVGPNHATDGGDTSVSEVQSPPSSTPEPQNRRDEGKEKNLEKARHYDWGKLKGQRVSNAYKIASSDGIDVTMITTTLLTDDGKQMVNPANWTISDISFHDDSLTINLHHESGDGSAISRMMRNM